MKDHCPHCSAALDPSATPPPNEGGGLECPHCGGHLPDADSPSSWALAPLRTDEPIGVGADAEDPDPSPDIHPAAILDPWKSTHRKILILGAAALLLLGGLVFFIAIRNPGKASITELNTINKTEVNEYFNQLIKEGRITKKDLNGIAGIEEFGGTFIGLTKAALPWREAEAIAKRTGGGILDLSQLGTARQEIINWLGRAHPDTLGKTTWILDGAEPLGIDSPDFGPVSTLDRPRRAFVFWPGNMPTGWEWAIKPKFDEALPFENGVARVRIGNKWGLIDTLGKEVHPPAFDFIGEFTEHGCAPIYQGDSAAIETIRQARSRWAVGMPGPEVPAGVTRGLIDSTGKVLARTEWQDVQNHIHGFTPVKQNDKWGYLDPDGKLAIHCEWDDVWRFSPEGFAVVTRAGKRAIIDRTGKTIVQPEWDGAINFCKEGIGAVRRGDGWAMLDVSGKLLTEPIWFLQWKDRRFDLGFIPVESSIGWGSTLLDKQGKQIIGMNNGYFPLENGVVFTRVGGENVVHGNGGKELNRFPGKIVRAGEGNLRVENGNQFGFLDANGAWAIPLRKGRAKNFVQELVAVSTDQKWGFINGSGEIVVPEEWDEVRDFSEGCAAVKRGELWGFVDRFGKTIVLPRYSMVGDFSCGVAAVAEDETKPPAANVRQDPDLVRLAALLRQRDRSAMERVRTLTTDKRNELNAILRNTGQGNQGRRWEFINSSGSIAFDLEADVLFYATPRFVNNRLWVTGSGLIDPKGRPISRSGDLPDVGTVVTIDRPGNYHDRHGVAGEVKVLQNAMGVSILAGVKGHEDFNSGLIPHALLPKYGLMDTKGNVLVETKWDEIQVLSAEWVWIGQNGKCGIADSTGRVVLEPVWDEVRAISPNWLWFRKGAKCGLANSTGKVIVEPNFSQAEVLRVRSASIAEDSNELLLGPGGRPIYSPWIRVQDRSGYKILQSSGQPAIPLELERAEFIDFYGPKHLVLVELGDDETPTWSLYEPITNTKTAFPNAERLFWNWHMSLSGLLWIQDKADSKWKLMRVDGKNLGHSQDAKPDGWELHDGLGLLQDSKGWFFVNGKGDRIGGDGWTNARSFKEGRAAFEKNGKWGFIDTEGKVIVEPTWLEVRDFSLSLAAVKAESGWWGFVGLDGKVAVQPVWDEIGELARVGSDPFRTSKVRERDVVPVRVGLYWGCIDRSGKLLVDPKHIEPTAEFVPLFNENGMAASKYPRQVTSWLVEGNGAPVVWGASRFSWESWREVDVDTNGKTISYSHKDRQWQYDDGSPVLVDGKPAGWRQRGVEWVAPFVNGRPVSKAGNWVKGDLMIDPFSCGLISARTNEQRFALLRLDGVRVTPPVHDRIAWVAPGIAAAWSRADGGLMDRDGKWIFRDNEKIRIARFGARNAKATPEQYRHGLTVIEDSPKWGFAALKR